MSTDALASDSQFAQREALERFVVENDEILQLEERLGRFNVFDALGVARAEIRHSNFLAWLLDPNESHGLGSLFLKAILMDLLRQLPHDRRAISPIELDGEELRLVEVRREWEHIDLLIVCREPQFILAVENKVDSSEHSDQLGRYRRAVESEFADVPEGKRMYVFLTAHAVEPSDEAWVPYSYADLHRVLMRLSNIPAGAIGGDVAVFLDHYLKLIGSRFMENREIADLCRQIYKKHRQALDLIFEYAPSPDTDLLEQIEQLLRTEGRWHVWKRDRYWVYFAPSDWPSDLPVLGNGVEVEGREWIYFFYEVLNGKLRRSMQVAPCTDADARAAIIDWLRSEYDLTTRGKGGTSWTRLGSDVLLELGDEVPDWEQVQAVVKGDLERLYSRFRGFSKALRGFLNRKGIRRSE